MPKLDALAKSETILSYERSLSRRVTLAYVAGLTLLAVLAGSVHVLLNDIIEQQRDVATIINVAGRQRMLSQRIGLLASDVHAGNPNALPPLRDAIALMRRSQNAIVNGGDLGITHDLTPEARSFYFSGASPLDPAVTGFIDRATQFATAPTTPDGEAAFTRLEADAHGPILDSLNQAVTIFEQEANHRIESLRSAQLAVLVALLVTIALEAFFIFRPLVLRIRLYADRLFELATRDALTGLANRRYFMDLANREFLLARRSGKNLGAVILDLDHFKKINDTYGHAVGDMVLQRFAALSTNTLRASDILARIGGEEFALVLPDLEPGTMLMVADKLRSGVAEFHSEELPSFTISVGVSLLDPKDSNIEDLLLRADDALYQAKNAGRNRVAYRWTDGVGGLVEAMA